MLLVILPCKERRNREAKRLLLDLQRSLRNTPAVASAASEDTKIVAVYTCKRDPESFVDGVDPKTLIGVLSFQPRPALRKKEMIPPPSAVRRNDLGYRKEVLEYCDYMAYNTFQLYRLGKKLSATREVNVVYTYDKGNDTPKPFLRRDEFSFSLLQKMPTP